MPETSKMCRHFLRFVSRFSTAQHLWTLSVSIRTFKLSSYQQVCPFFCLAQFFFNQISQCRKGRMCYSFLETFVDVLFTSIIMDYQKISLCFFFQRVKSFLRIPCRVQVLLSSLTSPKTSESVQCFRFVNKKSTVQQIWTL